MAVVPDIQEAILDCFVYPEDVSSLLKCGLVCKQWLAHTRPAVFAHYVVDLQVIDRGLKTERTKNFVELVSSPFSTFPKYTRKLILTGGSPGEPRGTDLKDPLDAIGCLTSLQSLSIKDPVWEDLPDLIHTKLRGLRNLTHFMLGNTRFESPDAVYQATLGTFPTLEDLEMEGCVSTTPPQRDEPHGLEEISLRSLILTARGPSTSRIVAPFLFTLPRIQSLEVRGVKEQSDVNDINCLIELLGSSLKHAIFDCKELIPVPIQQGALLATHFPVTLVNSSNLESLEVEMLIAPTPDGFVPQSLWLVGLCETIRSSKFTRLTIKLGIHPIILSVPMHVAVNFPRFLAALNRGGVFPEVNLIFTFVDEVESVSPERVRDATAEVQLELRAINQQRKLKIVWTHLQHDSG